MEKMIAVDWGTSSLRAALLGPQGRVLEEQSSHEGILQVAPGEFPAVLRRICEGWVDGPAGDAPLVLMSGMVGSRQGWQEASYCPCPAGFEDVAGALSWVAGGAGAPSLKRVGIVPGLSCEHARVNDLLHGRGVPDVMRGEETQVFGAMALLGIDSGLFVLPGTHSKWVRVRAGRIHDFHTFMTGEFYALLRQHSILARTLPEDDGSFDEAAFLRGVAQARVSGSLLHAAFSARTLALFDRMDAAAQPSYLSGLVIGEELRAQPAGALSEPVVVVGSPVLAQRYQLALQERGTHARCVGSEATWGGLWAIAQQLETSP